MKASVVMVVMKGPRASGYFGIGEVASREDISADPFPQIHFRISDSAQLLTVHNRCSFKVSALTAAASPVMFVSGATSCLKYLVDKLW